MASTVESSTTTSSSSTTTTPSKKPIVTPPPPPLSALPAKYHHIESNKTKFLGITPPVSTLSPTQHEIDLSKQLLETLQKLGLFESKEEAKKREEVLGHLYHMVRDFVKKMGMKRGLPDVLAEEAGGTLFTFGSYRLGVHGAGKLTVLYFLTFFFKKRMK
ncbi:polynucleotide adenylyltransferase [Coelomomyces lativittatus]|nr:polynucleotide adenylyltransferase [Coelomomyces lativittatus]